MISVKFKNGSVREYDNGTTIADVAKSLGGGIFKNACAGRLNGEVKDLRTVLESDSACELEILTFDDKDGKKTFWHTTSHILAQAVKRLYPQAKIAIGPAIDNGFYYDFDVEKPFSTEDIEKIEKENGQRNYDDDNYCKQNVLKQCVVLRFNIDGVLDLTVFFHLDVV